MNPAKKMTDLLEKPIEEVQREAAYWYLDAFKEIYVRPYPPMPKRYAEYISQPDFERREVAKEFWNIPEIKSYIGICESIKNERDSHLKTLREFKDYLPKEDFLNRKKYDEKIGELEYHAVR